MINIRNYNNQEIFPKDKIRTKSEELLLLRNISQGDRNAFWQLWLCYQDYLYHRCRTWMGDNYADAEEAFSQAMLKAWHKLPEYADKITNPKAWLTRLTHNLCVDMHRKRNRSAIGIESIEEMAVAEFDRVASSFDSPESEVLRSEQGKYIRRAINSLPPRLREPCILRFYQEMSYQDIARKLALSLDNVYKRIQQARKILQKQLNKYFSGLDLLAVEEAQCQKTKISATPVPKTEYSVEPINYEVTATCLEALSNAWYSFPSQLGWL